MTAEANGAAMSSGMISGGETEEEEDEVEVEGKGCPTPVGTAARRRNSSSSVRARVALAAQVAASSKGTSRMYPRTAADPPATQQLDSPDV